LSVRVSNNNPAVKPIIVSDLLFSKNSISKRNIKQFNENSKPNNDRFINIGLNK